MNLWIVILLALLCLSATKTYASPDTFPPHWKPLYDQCVDKFNMSPEIVQARIFMNGKDIPDELRKTMQSDMEKIEQQIFEMCSCMCVKADEGFRASRYDISKNEIELISQYFRLERQYPDKNVANLFGLSILPCMPF